MEESFPVTAEMLARRPEMAQDGLTVGDRVKGKLLHARYSRYMQRLAEVEPELVDALAEQGARFTHHASIAPTGTISLSLANNASNGIEPSFAHHYSRGTSFARDARRRRRSMSSPSSCSPIVSSSTPRPCPARSPRATESGARPREMESGGDAEHALPDYFVTADDITPRQHVDVQAAAQRWIDSSISKTANVPTDYPYEDFKDIYLHAFERNLKGCTTFRFNPSAFQGVLVKDKDLENTIYRFKLEDGTVVEARGDEEVEYDGDTHTAANLYDAIKEGYYGKF